MSLLQRTDVYQKAGHWHPALRPSGVMHNDVSEVTEADEDVLILNAPEAPRLVPDVMLERPGGCCGEGHQICGLRKVVWRPAHKVRGFAGRSHIVCSWCYVPGACPRACELMQLAEPPGGRPAISRSGRIAKARRAAERRPSDV
jgi:hypothetical protein